MPFKQIAFTSLIIVAAVMAVASLLTEPAWVYHSRWFAILWGVVAVSAVCHLIHAKIWRAKATMLIHMALLVILCGALTTHLYGSGHTLHLRYESPNDSTATFLPFRVELDTFYITYYQATTTPQDFTTRFKITDNDAITYGEVKMNHIFTYRHYRFYQAGYDADLGGSKLSVNYDPYGIAITYTGYLLLLVAMISFFWQGKSRFRQLLGKRLWLLWVLWLLPPTHMAAENTPKVVPTDIAEQVGDLYLYYNGRVCPVETFAQDFLMKINGKRSYRGRNSKEVLVGWIFFPNTWKPEPMIAVKGKAVKQLLGAEGDYLSLREFGDAFGRYRLEDVMAEIHSGEYEGNAAQVRAMDEKINILNMIFTGSALKIFPAKNPDGSIVWYSPADVLPDHLPAEQQLFIRKSLHYVNEKSVLRRYSEARELIAKIAAYQVATCGDALPTPLETKAEHIYNRVSSSKPWAMVCVALGLLAFIYFTRCATQGTQPKRFVLLLLSAMGVAVWIYLTGCFVLRTIISGHLPMANGYELMQGLAWICLLLMFIIQRRVAYALPFGFLVSGLALLVAMIGEANPTVTHLVPVLNSPLLSLHVMVIMIAYALFAFCMLNGIAAQIYYMKRYAMADKAAELRRSSELLLYPATFLLATGIFIGAVWANVSWGRYWGWDAKEVWALITLLLYALPLHTGSLSWFRDDRHMHLYLIGAFLSVLMTYFGANYFLTGLHAYA